MEDTGRWLALDGRGSAQYLTATRNSTLSGLPDWPVTLEVEPHAGVARVGAGIGSLVCQAHRYTSWGHFLAGFALPFIQDSGNRDNGGRSAPELRFRSGISGYREALDEALCFGCTRLAGAIGCASIFWVMEVKRFVKLLLRAVARLP
jgi:hypothetical protein